MAQRKALFRDSDGVLLAHGFCDFTASVGQTVRNVSEDFPFECFKSRWNGVAVEVYVIPAPTADEKATTAVDRMDRFQFEVMFNLENRVRALEGKAAITRVQYRTALVNAYKAMP